MAAIDFFGSECTRVPMTVIGRLDGIGSFSFLAVDFPEVIAGGITPDDENRLRFAITEY